MLAFVSGTYSDLGVQHFKNTVINNRIIVPMIIETANIDIYKKKFRQKSRLILKIQRIETSSPYRTPNNVLQFKWQGPCGWICRHPNTFFVFCFEFVCSRKNSHNLLSEFQKIWRQNQFFLFLLGSARIRSRKVI